MNITEHHSPLGRLIAADENEWTDVGKSMIFASFCFNNFSTTFNQTIRHKLCRGERWSDSFVPFFSGYTKKTSLPEDLRNRDGRQEAAVYAFVVQLEVICVARNLPHAHTRFILNPQKKRAYKRARQSSSLPSALLTPYWGVVIVTMYCARKIQNIQ